jgi:AcrR family transcriptional regulator
MELTGQYHFGEAMSDKPQQILKSAERLFAGGRYHEVTLDEVCREAGVGKGTVYRYFRDKEDLYYQVILSGLDELVESVEGVANEEQAPGDGMRKVVECVAGFYTKRRALFGLMWSEQLRGSARRKEMRTQWRKKNERMVAVLAGFITQGVQQGVYDTPFSPRAAARLLLGMVRVGQRHKSEMPGGRDWPTAVARLFEGGILSQDATE